MRIVVGAIAVAVIFGIFITSNRMRGSDIFGIPDGAASSVISGRHYFNAVKYARCANLAEHTQVAQIQKVMLILECFRFPPQKTTRALTVIRGSQGRTSLAGYSPDGAVFYDALVSGREAIVSDCLARIKEHARALTHSDVP